MQGNMWVESELSIGSKFFFTVTSQLSDAPMEQILLKTQPYEKRNILFVDTLHDMTGVGEQITQLGLSPFMVHDVAHLSEKSRLPHIDTILVDSLKVTEMLREIEHLRYIPVVLLAPSFPRLNRKHLKIRFMTCH
jgi:osomolarity two-component system sensor histidine kinase NIK1